MSNTPTDVDALVEQILALKPRPRAVLLRMLRLMNKHPGLSTLVADHKLAPITITLLDLIARNVPESRLDQYASDLLLLATVHDEYSGALIESDANYLQDNSPE